MIEAFRWVNRLQSCKSDEEYERVKAEYEAWNAAETERLLTAWARCAAELEVLDKTP